MEQAKIQQQKGSAKRADDAVLSPDAITGNNPAGLYYLFNTLLFFLKLGVILVMIFSMQNLSDMVRGIPVINNLPPMPALLFSYLVIHVFCMYFFIVWFGSFKEYFKRLGPTLIEIKGFLIYTIAVPLVFVLLAGAVWWSVSRIKIASIIGFPFQWIPNLISDLYMNGWPFYSFIVMIAALMIALLFLVVLLQKPVSQMKPAPKKAPARPAPERKIPAMAESAPAPETPIDANPDEPLQPKGQPPLRMK